MIEIDGSYREGGGQILRTASLLSCATGEGVHIFNIRKGRTNPGLRHQHLWGLTTLAQLYNADLKGAELGSMEVWFTPLVESQCSQLTTLNRKAMVGNQHILQIRIPTAGSITLVLQSLIIPAALFKREVKIIFEGGATDTSFSPTLNYYLYVLIPLLKRMGYKVEIDVKRRGYYPKGGAKLEAIVYPLVSASQRLAHPFELVNRGELRKVSIFSYASKFLEKRRVADRQAESAERVLKCDVEKEIRYFDTMSPGSSIDIIANYEYSCLGANALGELGKTSEKVGKEAAQILLEDMRTGACLDRYIADQILPYVAFSTYRWGSGFETHASCEAVLPLKSEFSVARVTEHCLTNMWVIEKFINGKFQVNGNIIRWG